MKKLARLAVILALSILLLPNVASAGTGRSAENVTVPAGQTLADDLYATGTTVRVDGTVSGSVIAAGSHVIVNGTVTGDVWAVGSDVTVNGTVGGSVRAAGKDVTVHGKIGGDLLSASSNLVIERTGSVTRDVWSASSDVRIDGSVGRNLKAGASTITLSGPVGGNASVRAGDRLTLAAGTDIRGTLDYHAPAQLGRDPTAKVAGAVTFTAKQHRSAGSSLAHHLAADLYWFLAAVILMLAILLYARRAARRAGQLILDRPGMSLLMGLGLLIGIPVAAGLLLITVVGIPLGFLTIGLYILLLYTAKIFVALSVGGMILRHKQDRFWSVFGQGLIGLALYYLLSAVPFIGPAVALAVTVFGLGAQALLFGELYAHGRRKFGS